MIIAMIKFSKQIQQRMVHLLYFVHNDVKMWLLITEASKNCCSPIPPNKSSLHSTKFIWSNIVPNNIKNFVFHYVEQVILLDWQNFGSHQPNTVSDE